MRKIAIINQKGGSCKTTTTVNLAAALAENNKKVLVCDIDPQASTTAWFGCATDTQSIYDLFVGNVHIDSIIIKTNIPGIGVIPSSSWLIGLEKRLAQEVGAEIILKQKLQMIKPGDWDYVLIDCPPTLGILTVNALTAVDEVIVPVEARVMALQGLVQLLDTIDTITQRLNSSLKISGIVPCRVDSRTKHAKEVVLELQNNFKTLVYKTAIRENIRLAEAPSFFQPITSYATESSGAVDYRLLALEVIKQEKVYKSC